MQRLTKSKSVRPAALSPSFAASSRRRAPGSALEPVLQPWTAPRPPARLLENLLGRRHPVFLDSASDHSGQGGWSFLACDPEVVLASPAWRRSDGGTPAGVDPFDGVALQLLARPVHAHPTLPFVGGAVGCWSYDLRYRLEGLPQRGADDLGLPDAWIGFYGTLYAYDHRGDQGYLLRAPAPGEPEADSRARLAALRHLLEAGSERARARGAEPRSAGRSLQSNFTREEYLRAVRRVKEYIAAGDIYQVNLSQRFSAPLAGPPAGLYQRLRQASPAPFAAYLDCGRFAVLSSSPERFLRIRYGVVETRPIKGTRPRGATETEDRRLAAELRDSEKDRAELLMIVDLERNDLGKVCEYGSVHVPRLFELESHPTVHHLVATVQGRLRPEAHPLQALRACFPGGSITGAPKIRAMEIIEELEPLHRGFYTGAIGYAGFDGGAEWNVAIRTMVIAGGRVTYSVGGGIVADSDPELEWEETLHKGRGMRRALEGEGGP